MRIATLKFLEFEIDRIFNTEYNPVILIFLSSRKKMTNIPTNRDESEEEKTVVFKAKLISKDLSNLISQTISQLNTFMEEYNIKCLIRKKVGLANFSIYYKYSPNNIEEADLHLLKIKVNRIRSDMQVMILTSEKLEEYISDFSKQYLDNLGIDNFQKSKI